MDLVRRVWCSGSEGGQASRKWKMCGASWNGVDQFGTWWGKSKPVVGMLELGETSQNSVGQVGMEWIETGQCLASWNGVEHVRTVLDR